MPATKSKRSTRSSRSASSNVTIDHDEIRRWVESRGGRPACVKATEKGDSCLLRIDFPGYSGEGSLEPIEWDEFFNTFDESNLAFVYQDSKNGKPSRFSKLVDRGSIRGGRSSSRGQSGGNRGGQSRSGGRSGGRSSGGRSRSNKSATRRTSSRAGGRASGSAGGKSSRRSTARSSRRGMAARR